MPEDINAEITVITQTRRGTRVIRNSLGEGFEAADVHVRVKVEQSGRIGEYTCNRLTAAGISAALAKAKANAAQGRQGPLVLTGSTGYRDMGLMYPATVQQSPGDRAKLLAPLLDIANTLSIQVNGDLTTAWGELVIANTSGLAAATSVSFARFSITATGMEGGGQGYGYACTRDIGELEIMEPLLTAAAKCQASSYPKSISGGEYTVILEPTAVAELMEIMARTVFSGRAFLDGYSPVTKIGQRLFGENINIWDDGLDPRGLAMPFDFQGVPKQRLNLVNRGVIPNIALDNETAAALNMAGTGHAYNPSHTGPRPAHIFMEPGNAMLDDMIASTRRGILVSRLRNLATLDPRSGIITGTTGNGTLLIENGKLTAALTNLRFVQNLVQLFNQVEMIGDETKLFGGLWGGIRVPALKIQGFSILGSNIGQG